MTNPERLTGQDERSGGDIQRIKERLGALGLASVTHVALRFQPKVENKETGEWESSINPKTGEPRVFPALLPLEDVDACPIPLSAFGDGELDEYLKSSERFRQREIGDDEQRIKAALQAGKLMVQLSQQRRASEV